MDENTKLTKGSRKWVSNAQENFGQEKVKPGDNARYLRHALMSLNLPPIDLDSDEQVQKRLEWYFNHCADNDMKPTVTGMANSLGIAVGTLTDWCRGTRRGKTDNRTEIIQQAYSVLAELWEDYMLNGKVNPASGIFIGKNHFGYSNEQKIVVEPKNPLGEIDNPEEVKQRYLDSTVED